jgi:hypothetical protein
MLASLIVATGLTLAQAGGECAVAVESPEPGLVRLRPACPLNYVAMETAVRGVLARATDGEVRLLLGRMVEYPWLSRALARQASSSRHWDTVEGTARNGSDNAYVAAALRGMPEFTALFGHWRIAGVSVEKVLRKPAGELPLPVGAPLSPKSLLPFDAIVWVTLKK